MKRYDAHTSTSVADEVEKLAEAFEANNLHLAAICLRKIVDRVPQPQLPSEPEAFSRHFHAEAHKVSNAFDDGNLSLAGMCLRKAVKAVPELGSLPDGVLALKNAREALQTAEHLAQLLSSGDLHGSADLVRKLGRCFEFAPVEPAPPAQE